MRRFGLALALFLLSTPLVAIIPMVPLDVAGDWNLELTVQLPNEGGSCTFGGYAQVIQDGSQFSGTASLFLVEGAAACPAEMSANISGTVAGGVIETGMLEGGNLGTASFTGSLLNNKAEGPMSGGTMVLTGPFAGAMGMWTAFVGNAVSAIPVLGPVGIAVMVGILLTVALLFLHRGRLPV
jgi:hypothetical protein